MNPLKLMPLRELNLSTPTSPGRPLHLAAASGLVQVGDFLYVVADDEFHLGIFSATQATVGNLFRLFDGELPDELEERKAQKPDMEALAVLPAFDDYPYGALLAIGSGSKKRRRRGIVLGLAADGTINTLPRILDLSELYAELKHTFDDLNIEGAFVTGDTLYLLQRGNKSDTAQNASIAVELPKVLKAIRKDKPVSAQALGEIRPYSLGEAAGVPLCFTDAALLPDGSWVFTAAAEATDNSYQDGAFVGAAIGIMTAAGELFHLERLDATYKIEGVSARVEGNTVQLLLVTDADNPAQAASLLVANWDGYPFISQ